MGMHELSIIVKGFRSGLELDGGQIRIWNKAAKSDITFPVEQLTGVTSKKPGIARGYVAVQSTDNPAAPSGLAAAANHPQTVILALGAWNEAQSFIQAAYAHLDANPPANVDDPYAQLPAIRDRALVKQLETARPLLHPGEKVLAAMTGAYETKKMGEDWTRTGAILATDRRLLFVAKKLGGYDSESFPYERISSFDKSTGMTGGRATFYASGNTVNLKYIAPPELEELTRVVNDQTTASGQAPSSPAPTEAAPHMATAADQVRALAQLRDDGLITDEEFDTKRRELLGL